MKMKEVRCYYDKNGKKLAETVTGKTVTVNKAGEVGGTDVLIDNDGRIMTSKSDEAPLIAPTVNFTEQKDVVIDNGPLVAPKLDFSGQGDTGTSMKGEQPLCAPQLTF